MADLVTVRTDGGKSFRVARDQAQRILNMLNDIELRMPIGQDSGGYAPRHIAGTNIPSRHATGHAVDLNWTSNPEGKRGAIRQYLTPEELAGLEKTHGVDWGGRWNRPFKGSDDMHFETLRNAAPAPLGAPLQRMPASAGLNEVPKQGMMPLSLLPAYRGGPAAPSPFVASAAPPSRVAAAPPPTQEPAIPATPAPAKPSEKPPPFQATPPKPAPRDDGFAQAAAQAHAAAVQQGQRVAQEWMQRQRPVKGLSAWNDQLFGAA